jgi:hypothetical protein
VTGDLQRFPRGRGPYGTVPGDCWLSDDSEIGRRVTEDHPGAHLVVEVVISTEDGRPTESFYTTQDEQLVERARRGRKLYDSHRRWRNNAV